MFRGRFPHARAALFAMLAMAAVPAPADAATLDDPDTFTAVVVQPIVSPRPVEGADGRTHLVYELLFVNETALLSRVDAIEALDAETGAVLGAWKGEALKAIFRLNGREPGQTLARGHSAYAFLDATVLAERRRPRRSSTALPSRASWRRPATSTRPLRSILSSAFPRRRRSWACRSTSTPARRSSSSRRSGVRDGSRQRLLWVTSAPRRDHGVQRRAEDRGTLRHRLHAARSVTPFVRRAARQERELSDLRQSRVCGRRRDGGRGRRRRRRGRPFASREPTTIQNAAGNHIVLDIGGGNFALFAHIETGTVAVKAGDRVKAGDVSGRGRHRNSMPDLHFHVMDGPSPLASNGLPATLYAIYRRGPAR